MRRWLLSMAVTSVLVAGAVAQTTTGPVQVGVRELQQNPAGGVSLVAAPAPPAVIDTGTIAGQALTWVVTTFGGLIGLTLTGLIYRMLQKAGIDLTDAQRDRLDSILVNGMHVVAPAVARDMAGRGQIEVRNAAVAQVVRYAQVHGADTLKSLAGDPLSQIAVEAIKARIERLAADPATPTPPVFDPKVPDQQKPAG
jgi:hypothetical protein